MRVGSPTFQHSGLWPVLYRLQEPQIQEYVQPRNPLRQQILPQQIMRGSMMFWYVNIWTSLINQTNNILTSSKAFKHWPKCRTVQFVAREALATEERPVWQRRKNLDPRCLSFVHTLCLLWSVDFLTVKRDEIEIIAPHRSGHRV